MAMLSSYVLWYNQKYKRTGNLFQDRYRSEAVNSDAHLLCTLRYIHQNPIKAGIVKDIGEYPWSSDSAYVTQKQSFVDTEFMLSVFGRLQEYKDFMLGEETGQFIEDRNTITVTDEDVAGKLKGAMKRMNIYDLQKCEREDIRRVISAIRQTVKGASLRQISRVTGISVGIIRNIE